MSNPNQIKIKNYSKFLLFLIIVVGLSYLLVYKLNFLPNGFDLILQQQDSIIIKSFNLFGVPKDISTVSFPEEEVWKLQEIAYEINRQKEFLWLLYSALGVCLFLLISKLREQMNFWKAILDSNFIFAVVLPVYFISNSINRIQNIIS